MVNFPEPEWKLLKYEEILYFKDRYVDNTPWELLVKYWGITKNERGRWGSRYTYKFERTPVYPYYNRKDIKSLIKMK